MYILQLLLVTKQNLYLYVYIMTTVRYWKLKMICISLFMVKNQQEEKLLVWSFGQFSYLIQYSLYWYSQQTHSLQYPVGLTAQQACYSAAFYLGLNNKQF